MRLRGLGLIGVLALAGCGSLGGSRDGGLPPPPKASDYTAEVGFQPAWSYSALELPAVQQGFGLVPAVDAGRVYVAGRDGRVVALDGASGAPIWQVDLKRQLSSGPAVAGGRLVVGSRDGGVIALDAADGGSLWQATVTSEVLAPPRVSDDRVVIRSLDGRVFGLDAATGARQWLFEQSVPVLTLRGVSAPVLVPGQLVAVGLDTGKLVGLNPADGKLLWETPVATPQGRTDLERMVDIDADPRLYRGEIYVVSYQGRLAAVDPANGRIKWQRELSAYAGLAVDSSRVYVTDAEQQLWAFDRFNGATVWRQDALKGLKLTAPALAGDYLIVGDNEGYLNWLSPRDGSLQRRQKVGGGFVAAPLVEAGGVYLLTKDRLGVLR